MADEATNTSTEAAGESTADSTTTDTATESPAVTEGEKSLGDAGKKALDAMKAERNQAKSDLAALRSEFDAFKAKQEGKEAEHAAAVEAQRLRDEALAAANERILKAELRATAKGKVADDVLPHVHTLIGDLSAIEVSADGEVNQASLADAVNDLLTRMPSLSAQGKRFEGTADGGARNEAAAKTVDEQIAEAEKAGDWATARQLKVRKLTDLPQQN